MRGLKTQGIVSQPANHEVCNVPEPYGTTQGPNYRNQREASRHICLVCELRQHTLDYAYVPVKHAI
jgi:hypothetical protein